MGRLPAALSHSDRLRACIAGPPHFLPSNGKPGCVGPAKKTQRELKCLFAKIRLPASAAAAGNTLLGDLFRQAPHSKHSRTTSFAQLKGVATQARRAALCCGASPEVLALPKFVMI